MDAMKMNKRVHNLLMNSLLFTLLVTSICADEGGIELLRTIRVPGNLIDKSGLSEPLAAGLRHDVFGGISALEYLGQDDLYLALPDRGPKDGAIDWTCRIHVVRIPRSSFFPNLNRTAEQFSIVSTTILRDGERVFSGFSGRITPTLKKAARLDPEGIRLGSNGDFFLSDEYGPHLLQFDRDGRLTGQVQLPQRYKITNPGLTKRIENSTNDTGRQGNRGIEGLAVSSCGRRLYGLFQSPLLQDCEKSNSGKTTGRNCRLFEYEIENQSMREFLYPLESTANKLNEILTINAEEFLVIERDGKAGADSVFKKIFKISIAGAGDVQKINKLPSDRIPNNIVPVSKELFIDLLDGRFRIAGPDMPEKIESLSFGPDLSDGRRTLLVVSDNDFETSEVTCIYCFAVPPTSLAK